MSPRILIIDDDRLNITLLKFSLKEKRFEVTTAGDGIEGLQAVAAERPDLIILDVQMPNMSGFEFMSELKSLPGGANIPVIMLTANENMQDIFFSEGVKGYFVKPINPPLIEAKIRQVLGITGDILP
ncbi:MAG: response regulator [Candidatus Omnitrophica bacterium]|nr:response regulator [Candidatus Omnitrophota bacterium]